MAEKDGCTHLMREITSRSNFVASDVVGCSSECFHRPTAMWNRARTMSRDGAIQNLGVHPEFRNLGVGRALLIEALRGFRSVGCMFANLEVTMQNTAAIRLYERFGFVRAETVFKVADVQYA